MSIKKIAFHVFAALIIFLVLVVLRMPANIVSSQLPKYAPQIKVSGVSGTVWDGHLNQAQVLVNGRPILLNNISWRINVLPLLLLKISGDIEVFREDQYLRTEFDVSQDKAIHLENLEARVNIAEARPFIPLMPESSGYVEALLSTVKIQDQTLVDVDGSVVVNELKVVAGSELDLGTFGAKVSVSEDMIIATVSDIDASIGMEGDVSLRKPDFAYRIHVALKTKDNTPEMIKQNIKNFTRIQPDGSFRFTFSSKI